MDAVTLYRIVSLVSLWLAGTVGVACPILGYVDSDKHTFFVLLTGLSTGVVLGVAWLHLLADAQEQFAIAKVPGDLDGDDYPWANLCLACGTLSMAFVDFATGRPKPVRLADTSRNAVLLGGAEAQSAATRRKVFALELSILVHSVMIGLTYLFQDAVKLLPLSVRNCPCNHRPARPRSC